MYQWHILRPELAFTVLCRFPYKNGTQRDQSLGSQSYAGSYISMAHTETRAWVHSPMQVPIYKWHIKRPELGFTVLCRFPYINCT